MWKCAGFTLDTGKPLIMGVLNLTPNSFSDGGQFDSVESACAYARLLVRQGATIIDVGGESTRPGSREVSEAEELARVLPVVSCLASEGLIVSIDTRHASVARVCIEAGAAIINDISGFRNLDMVDVAASCETGLIVVHMQGEPENMQHNPSYTNVTQEIGRYLIEQARRLEAAGVQRSRICIDPGPGFGKTFAHNLELLKNTQMLANLGYPLVAAWSRKSFIGELTGIEVAAERDVSSALIAACAASRGARILRVHNVAATVEAVKVLESLKMTGATSRVFVGLGSNIGDSSVILKAAIEKIAALPGVMLAQTSSFYESEPAYLADQSRYLNAVIEIYTQLGPYELLWKLQGIEEEFGRNHAVVNGPRSLDLDIIDYEGALSDDPELLLPHPLALERDFIVTPLQEIAPSHVFADGIVLTYEGVEQGSITGRVPQQKLAGKLSICATPIGNLGDITRRVIDTLAAADLVLAEDTRIARKLLSHLNIRPRLERCDETIIARRSQSIIESIKRGSRVAFISDSGMPGISDPGTVLVRAAQLSGCSVEVLPGASAVTTAVAASGFNTSEFYFGAFLPRKEAQIAKLLEQLAPLDAILVFFESPHRITASTAVIARLLPDREVVIARELTKHFEEVIRASAPELAALVAKRENSGNPLKGEIVLLIGPPEKSDEKRVHKDRYADKAPPPSR